VEVLRGFHGGDGDLWKYSVVSTEATEIRGSAPWFPRRRRRFVEVLRGFHGGDGEVGNCSVGLFLRILKKKRVKKYLRYSKLQSKLAEMIFVRLNMKKA
jgi:hypothetical protein